jgi:hypothetical protein
MQDPEYMDRKVALVVLPVKDSFNVDKRYYTKVIQLLGGQCQQCILISILQL